ncbi:hypothetical protein Droror1_Dr00018150, partial [Drosera rotundifolia]
MTSSPVKSPTDEAQETALPKLGENQPTAAHEEEEKPASAVKQNQPQKKAQPKRRKVLQPRVERQKLGEAVAERREQNRKLRRENPREKNPELRRERRQHPRVEEVRAERRSNLYQPPCRTSPSIAATHLLSPLWLQLEKSKMEFSFVCLGL